jgi:DNA-binding transcriptional ArsR family regulator
MYFTNRLINCLVKYVATDSLSLIFAALAHSARRQMLARLGQGEASVQELAQPLAMTLPAVSKHLKVLERAGLIKRGRDAQWRPAKLEAKPMKEAADWMDQYRQEWEDRFDRLEAYLKGVQELAEKDKKKEGSDE